VWGMRLREFVPGDHGQVANGVATALLCCAILLTSCAALL
jgi:hypothetical protein